jgi:hypothetical protein
MRPAPLTATPPEKYALEQLPREISELETLIDDSKKLLSDSSLFTKDLELFSKTATALDKIRRKRVLQKQRRSGWSLKYCAKNLKDKIFLPRYSAHGNP